MKKGESARRGFTIIEVVLVLAVAGLIFAMAFIAVPSLQRSQRDNDRRDDIIKLVTEVKRYQTSNRGNLPGAAGSSLPIEWDNIKNATNIAANTWAGFYKNYLGERFMDPDGNNYKLNVVACGAKRADASCSSDAATIISTAQSASFSSNAYKMLIVTQGKCSGNDIVGSSSPRSLAVMYRLEGSGVYCYGT